MDTRASTTTRLSLIPVVIALLMNLVIGPLAPALQAGIGDVLAAPETVPDEDGPNDEPGQKDLTQLTIDYAGLPATVFVSWNWDEISWSGANTGDGCALFDTDDDLFVDAAICVTISEDPADLLDVRLYECTADAKVDRCTGPAEVAGDLDSTCAVDQANTDPFANGDEHPVDTVATCTIVMSEIAATTADLVNVCSYPSQEPNSDPSDCVLIIRDGVLHVTKVVVNDSGGSKACTDFTFQVDLGAAEAFEADCTTEIAVEPGDYSVTEPAVPGYATTYANSENGNLNCTDLNVGSFSDADDIVTCTISNNDIGASLTVTKIVTNDNGGDATCGEFSFSVNGGTAVPFDGTDCSNTMPVNAGTYTVTEPVVAAGYTPSFSNCSNILIGLGGSATCTITNNDNAPSLTLVKVVTNDNGGTLSADDWTLSASGPTPISGDGSVSSGASFGAGSYDLSESGPDNYAASEWACVGTGTQDDADSVTLELGESLTCTITNDDDAPGLTLVKVVENDNGGTGQADDWTLTADGPTGFSGTTGVSSDADFDAGTYDLSEDGPSGYDASAWVCVGGTQDDDDTVTVGLGESVTCTITNDDSAPSLTLVKEVINDHGGQATAADWMLTASGPTGFSGAGPSASSGALFEAGSYDLSESGPAGYADSAWDCEGGTQDDDDTVTLALGESATCTITNDDIPATLIVEKVIVGGDLVCENFSFEVNGGTAIQFEADCSNELTVDAGDYLIVEPSVDGYTTTYENCDLSLDNDETATCTITNTRDTGGIEVVKLLDPATDPGRFDLLIDGTVVAADATNGEGGSATLETGTYEVGEEAGTGTTLSDYDSSILCIDRNAQDTEVASSEGTDLFVEVTKDADILCTISNTAIDVGLEKEHDEDDGKVEPGDIIEFELTVSVNVGNSTNVVVTDTLPDGLTYVDGSASIEPDDVTGQTLTWDLGTLAAGSYPITYEASVDADAAGLLKNLACLDADQNPIEICTDTSLLVQNVVVTKTNGTSGSVIPGTAVDFAVTLDVTNGPIESLIIVDQLPDGIAVTDETTISDGGLYDATANTITWMLTDVEDGELLTYEAVVSATATAGAYTNVATITDGPCIGDGCDDDSTVTVRVPTLVVDKTASTATITISTEDDELVADPEIVTWTLTWTLTDGPVTNATISDEIPVGFEFLDASDGGALIAGEVVWTFATLDESGSVTFRTTVDPETISRVGPTVNVAVIDSDETEPDEGEDSVTVVVEPPVLVGNPRPSLPNTAAGFGINGEPVTIPVELLVALFLGSLGALALANVKARNRR
jgi:fimbrial isopeptide formation D2 family protein